MIDSISYNGPTGSVTLHHGHGRRFWPDDPVTGVVGIKVIIGGFIALSLHEIEYPALVRRWAGWLTAGTGRTTTRSEEAPTPWLRFGTGDDGGFYLFAEDNVLVLQVGPDLIWRRAEGTKGAPIDVPDAIWDWLMLSWQEDAPQVPFEETP